MKTETLLILGAAGAIAWQLYQQSKAASSGLEPVVVTPMQKLSGLGDSNYDPGGWGWRHRNRARNMGVSPGQYSSIEYGGASWGGPGWQPYSPSAAFGPSPVEMETPGSIAFLASEIDAGNF